MLKFLCDGFAALATRTRVRTALAMILVAAIALPLLSVASGCATDQRGARLTTAKATLAQVVQTKAQHDQCAAASTNTAACQATADSFATLTEAQCAILRTEKDAVLPKVCQPQAPAPPQQE